MWNAAEANLLQCSLKNCLDSVAIFIQVHLSPRAINSVFTPFTQWSRYCLGDFKNCLIFRRHSPSGMPHDNNLSTSELCCPGGLKSKRQRKWKERQVLWPCQRNKKKLWNMKVTVIIIATGVFRTNPKGLVMGLEDLKSENEQRPSKQKHCEGRLEYWEESWRFEETCCNSDSNEGPSANVSVKIMIIIIIKCC